MTSLSVLPGRTRNRQSAGNKVAPVGSTLSSGAVEQDGSSPAYVNPAGGSTHCHSLACAALDVSATSEGTGAAVQPRLKTSETQATRLPGHRSPPGLRRSS